MKCFEYVCLSFTLLSNMDTENVGLQVSRQRYRCCPALLPII